VNPVELIGMPYRLGANPAKHGAADCLSLCCTVLQHLGYNPPTPERSWYRRLKRGDTSVFPEQLDRYCERVDVPKIGSVALCHSPLGYGMAVYFEGGWLCFVESVVAWRPSEALQVKQLYCLTK